VHEAMHERHGERRHPMGCDVRTGVTQSDAKRARMSAA
jgi:hypothetical protein